MDGLKPLAELWQQRIAQQRQGVLSVAQFCKLNGLSRHSFYRWRRRFAFDAAAGSDAAACLAEDSPSASGGLASSASAGGFAAVLVSLGVEPLRLKLAGGRELILPASMPPESIARLVREIEVRS
ncbi:MAG TPA: hypothetical protein VH370_09580 [Humisphaera sp.]|jgi:hypothetical protein|nr:hypothetical protein [Humisphaera sp.]